MHPSMLERRVSRAQILAERAFARVEHFLHIEAVSGAVLVFAAAVALVWANSPLSASYHHVWHIPLNVGFGDLTFSRPLHFWINDILMTVFFLVVGMEIRREMHEGALKDIRQAALPVAAAIGGVVVPAVLYLALSQTAPATKGWAVPTATDIAFAVGVLALLGRSLPSTVRIFLLTLAIIDDIIAVLIIAFVYTDGLNYIGFAVSALGLFVVFLQQRMGLGSAWLYVLPGGIVWAGLLISGVHPTLAGVVLGLLTPVTSVGMREEPSSIVGRFVSEFSGQASSDYQSISVKRLRELRRAQREFVPPVVRVQTALHPWVAFLIMPIFALANAGVSIEGVDLGAADSQMIMMGTAIALILGKPAGILVSCWLMVRIGGFRLPQGMNWGAVLLVGMLAGIGFTMSIFIAMLAFANAEALAAAKLGVLVGSVVAGSIGLMFGLWWVRRYGHQPVVAKQARA